MDKSICDDCLCSKCECKFNGCEMTDCLKCINKNGEEKCKTCIHYRKNKR